MVVSPPSRNNPFRSQGLRPGVTVQLQVTVRDHTEGFTTRVEDVTERGISVLVPMERLRPRPLPTGAMVRGSFRHDGRAWQFTSEVVGHSPDGTLDILSLPPGIETYERRSAFRLRTALQPRSVFRLVVDRDQPADQPTIDCSVVDLSEGGCCLSTRQRLSPGERLGMELDLPSAGAFVARMRVAAVDEPARGQRNFRVHCQFTDIALADRDRIARYLMRRQLEMRRRGQL